MGLTPRVFGLESCGRWISLTFPPLAGRTMFICQWILIQVISIPLLMLVRPLSMSSLIAWVNPNSSRPTMALHILQLVFSSSVRPIRYITPPAFLIILKGRP
jgi:hypothetical protein